MTNQIIDILREVTSPQNIANFISKTNKPSQPIRDLIFSAAVMHPFASISVAQIEEIIGNVPVIRRGTNAYAVNNNDSNITVIEPQPIHMTDFISAVELNNLKNVGVMQVQNYINLKIQRMLNIIHRTTEALCAQAITGKINYQMSTNGTVDSYVVDFGETLRFDLAKKWSDTSCTIAKVFSDLKDMHALLQKKGYGSKVLVLAGVEAYTRIIELADLSKSNIVQVKLVDQNTISVGGYTVKMENGSYIGKDKSAIKKIDDKSVVMIDIDAQHTPYYLALDSVEHGLNAIPFAITTNVKSDSTGYEIYGFSKPLPAPVVGAICWSQVL